MLYFLAHSFYSFIPKYFDLFLTYYTHIIKYTNHKCTVHYTFLNEHTHTTTIQLKLRSFGSTQHLQVRAVRQAPAGATAPAVNSWSRSGSSHTRNGAALRCADRPQRLTRVSARRLPFSSPPKFRCADVYDPCHSSYAEGPLRCFQSGAAVNRAPVSVLRSVFLVDGHLSALLSRGDAVKIHLFILITVLYALMKLLSTQLCRRW